MQGVESVSSFKPLQGSGGGIQQIFNVRNNNKKSFVPDLFQEKLQPLQSSFVPGDEPLKFIDSQHSKQVAVQKRFYQKGLYKQKGRFSRALTHLLETNKLSSDDDSIDTPVTSNNSTIDMSNIDFNIPSKKLKVMIPPQSLKSRSDFCDYLFQDKDSIPKEITDTIQSVHIEKDEHVLDPILGSDSYTNVINCIEVMDDALGEFNNGDLDTDWYDVVDISAVRLQTEFINEVFSNSDIYHEEDFDNNSIVDRHADTIDIDEIYLIVDIDEFYCIEVIDNNNGEDNNDLALNLYDVVDVYTVRFQIDLGFNDQETTFLHPSSTTDIKFRFPFLTIDKGTSFNSSVDSNDLSPVSLGSASTDTPSGIQVATIVVHKFDDNNLNVDNKGKENQQSIVIINMEYQQTILSMTESYFKSQSSSKPFLYDPRASSVFFSGIDLSPFLTIFLSDVPGLDPSRGPRNYPSMFFSLFPIQDCGWVYRTNFTTNSNHSSIFHFNILILITTHVFIQVLLMQD